jgi:hypothetical protein
VSTDSLVPLQKKCEVLGHTAVEDVVDRCGNEPDPFDEMTVFHAYVSAARVASAAALRVRVRLKAMTPAHSAAPAR